ncbi:putative alpha beta hydrolase [Phaeomoniella chlamydospora]|uniref:Putative alpha beta hydrolase n=1 Tax=Phaeomoniella chlamydospora TaxID=158046 RepID=A0A0G2EPP4_PHACM|nr:putative alpha beta hydrolase [Phaeomoniella chlamydospora]
MSISNVGRRFILNSGPRTIFTKQLSTQIKAPAASKENQKCTLPDGRTLGFAEYGSPTGEPVFLFHGLPGSRLEGREWEQIGRKLGARIIATDRPGMGLSSFKPDRNLLDWPADVKYLAQHLNLDHYRVVGGSGGGPFAVACAKMLPKKNLHAVGILAGVGPWKYLGGKGMRWKGRIAFSMLAYTPWVTKWVVNSQLVPAAHHSDPQVFKNLMQTWKDDLNEKDRTVFQDSRTWDDTVDVMRECFRIGSEGYLQDGRIMTADWGFELEEVPFEGVKLWWGTDDEHTPVRMGRFMASHLKNAKLKEFPGATHMTVFFLHREEILRDLLRSD